MTPLVRHDYLTAFAATATIGDLEMNLYYFGHCISYWRLITRNPNVDLLFIEKHADKISWSALTYSPIITQEFVEKHIDKDWFWFGLSMQRCIDISFIKKHSCKSWDWSLINNREERRTKNGRDLS